jgi:hypothetical protein
MTHQIGRRSKTRGAAFVAAVGLMVAIAAPASATTIDRGHDSYTDSGGFDDCGFMIEYAISGTDKFVLRANAAGTATLLVDAYSQVGVFTNPDNGKWFLLDHRGTVVDLRAVQVAGTTYQYVTIEAGRPLVVKSSDGKTVAFDRGVIRETYQIDTQGDTNPDNDAFVPGSFSLIAVNGPHPGMESDFCDVAWSLIGS